MDPPAAADVGLPALHIPGQIPIRDGSDGSDGGSSCSSCSSCGTAAASDADADGGPADLQPRPSPFPPLLAEPFQPQVDSRARSSSDGAPRDSIFAAANPRSRRDTLRELTDKAKGAAKQRHRGGGSHRNRKQKVHERLEKIGLGDGKAAADDRARIPKTPPFVTQATRLLVHPKKTIKAKVTSTVAQEISGLNEPYITPKTDVEFIAAHIQRECAEDRGEAEDAERAIQELHRRRKNMRIGWTMARHIHTIRAVKRQVRPWPEKKEFVLRDENGEALKDNVGNEKVDWLKWLGHFLLYMTQNFTFHYIDEKKEDEPLNIDRVRDIGERIFVCSAPWQEWYLHVRRVYRWEDPYETFRWFLLYVVLWHYQKIGAFLYGYICYATLRNYLFPSTVEELAASIERGRSRSKSALQFGDLVAQYGPEGWIYPLLESVGPWAQIQLGDLANLLEVLMNFWEWASPRQTAYTLCFFMTCFFVAVCADMEFCMKVVYFVVGGTFFFSFPVSSHYPKYRYLVSTLKWVFWNVPTHAEWAFEELRLAAQDNREDLISSKVEELWNEETYRTDGTTDLDTDPDDEDSDAQSFYSATSGPRVLEGTESLKSFKCRCGMDAGKLRITPDGLLFETRRGREVWRQKWADIVEMSKTGRRHGAAKLVSSKRAIEIEFLGGVRVRVDELKKTQDEVFNRILGASGLRWQCVN